MITQNKRKFNVGDRVLYRGKYPATVEAFSVMTVVKIKFDKTVDLPEYHELKHVTVLWTVEKHLTAEGPKGDPSWKDIWDNN